MTQEEILDRISELREVIPHATTRAEAEELQDEILELEDQLEVPYEEAQAKIEELKSLIKIELDMCDASSTPWLCDLKEANYSKAEKLIIEKIANEGHSVNTAIIEVERTYNLDYPND